MTTPNIYWKYVVVVFLIPSAQFQRLAEFVTSYIEAVETLFGLFL